MRLRLAVLFVIVTAVAVPATASASEIIDRNANDVSLKVAQNGQALVSYTRPRQALERARVGRDQRVAPDARPQAGRVQDRLLRRLRHVQARRLEDVQERMRRVRRPQLQWFVAGCKAADGSYWALQSWQRMLPNYGLKATPKQSVWELRLSHFRGALPVLTVNLNWAYRKYHHIFGSFTYLGKPGLRLQVDVRRRPAGHVRPQPLSSTRSTRPTARAGCARTAS